MAFNVPKRPISGTCNDSDKNRDIRNAIVYPRRAKPLSCAGSAHCGLHASNSASARSTGQSALHQSRWGIWLTRNDSRARAGVAYECAVRAWLEVRSAIAMLDDACRKAVQMAGFGDQRLSPTPCSADRDNYRALPACAPVFDSSSVTGIGETALGFFRRIGTRKTSREYSWQPMHVLSVPK